MSWRSIEPAQREILAPPFFCSDPRNPLARGRAVDWPEAGLAELPNARVLDEHAWVVGEHDTFLGDFCYTGASRHSRVNHIVKLHPPRHLAGRTLNLCSANAVTNFFHYAIDSISRAELVHRAGCTWDDFDHILLSRFHSATSAEIEAALQLPAEKIIRIARRDQWRCDVLVQPSFPGPLACTPRWVFDFYRRQFPLTPATRHRKLYFPRRGNRHPKNEAALAVRLAAAGFETVDPLRTPDLRQRMAQASHVVGVHGASFANLVFCAPDTRVLELMPTEISAYYNRWFYYTLCAAGDLPYGVVIGRSPSQRLTPYSPQPKNVFEVNLDDFDRGLAALLAS